MPPRVETRRATRATGRARGRPPGTGGRRGRRAGRAVGPSEASVEPQGSGIHVEVPVDSVAEVEIPVEETLMPVQVVRREPDSKLFDQFLKRDPPRFYGVGSPSDAMEFLRNLEVIFEPMGIDDGLRVRFATYRLHEAARDWWDNLRVSLTAGGEDPVTWERFVALFRENFCLSSHMAALERELIMMTQGDRSVMEYERRFSELCRLLPTVHSTESQRILRFRDGLIWDIRTRISMLTFTRFHEVRNAAVRVEMELDEPGAIGLKRARQETASTGGASGSRFQRRTFQSTRPTQSRFSTPVRPSYSASPSLPGASVRSVGSSRSVTRTPSDIRCYQCGQVGHLARDCRLRGTSSARCFRCGQEGHVVQECRERGVVCFRCQQPGHISRECPQNSGMGGASTSSVAQSVRGGYQGSRGGRFGGRGGQSRGAASIQGSTGVSTQSGVARGRSMQSRSRRLWTLREL